MIIKENTKLFESELLSLGIEKLGIPENISAKLIDKLKIYIKEIQIFNKAFNLIKFSDGKDLIVSHILDSLSAWNFFYDEILEANKKINSKNSVNCCPDENFLIADVGSGAGLPGIPLAIFFKTIKNQLPFVKVELIERMSKRCSFLANQTALLDLENVSIKEIEIEKAQKNKFDILTCRAFRTLDEDILLALLNATKKNGKLFLYKATMEKIEEDIGVIKSKNLNYKIEKLMPPFLDKERNLLIIEK